MELYLSRQKTSLIWLRSETYPRPRIIVGKKIPWLPQAWEAGYLKTWTIWIDSMYLQNYLLFSWSSASKIPKLSMFSATSGVLFFKWARPRQFRGYPRARLTAGSADDVSRVLSAFWRALQLHRSFRSSRWFCSHLVSFRRTFILYSCLLVLSWWPLLLSWLCDCSWTGVSSALGPFLARISDLWRAYYQYNGLPRAKLLQLYEKHGPIIRYGVNSISISDPSAISVIYGSRAGFVTVIIIAPIEANWKLSER